MEGSSKSSGKRSREEDDSNQPKRPAIGSSERRQSNFFDIVKTRPRDGPSRADGVTRFKLLSNYFRLPSKPNWNIYKYVVRFEPEVLNVRFRNMLIMQHKERIGGSLFDGSQIFVIQQLTPGNEVLTLESKTRTDEVYQIKFEFTKVVQMSEAESLQVLNLILRRATAALKLTLVGHNYYDPQSQISINQFRIQLWPGFTTSIRRHENDILLNCDVAHKVMRTDTVYQIMKETLNSARGDFRNIFKQKIIGATVLTEYNNSTYRVDDVDFDKKPTTTFDMKGVSTTIKEYYSQKYRLEIRDENQPLLISRVKEKAWRGGAEKEIWLVPELCRMTGLSERLRNDINLKNAMKQYSQMQPRLRRQRLLDFNQRIQSTEDSMKVMREWNLRLDEQLLEVDAHCLLPEKILFGNNAEHVVANASWDSHCGRGLRLFYVPNELKRWYLVFSSNLEREVNRFLQRSIEIGRNMGFIIHQPRKQTVNNDRAIVGEIDRLANTNPQLMFFVLASNKNNNAEIYSSIKKKCFCDNTVASQIVTKFNLSKDRGYDSIVTKIVIQMAAKLGCAPWSTKIPLGGVMTIGFDISRDSCDKNISYGCLVATMDLKESPSYFATVSRYTNLDALSSELFLCVRKAIEAFRNRYACLPKKIIIYRGGVGNGDIRYVKEVELHNLEKNLKRMYEGTEQQLQMAFIIVSKKISARFFEGDRNPSAGTVVDTEVVLPERIEFFLVSQHSTQGTVSPTNYNVIYDTTELSIQKLQIWTYKQCHLYYNWCGTTRVPAVLQYATKLCFMVSNFLHRIPNDQPDLKLYFL